MRSRHKHTLNPDQIDALLDSAGIHRHEVRACVDTGGTYNTVYRLRLIDGSGAILKIAPGPTAPILAYERGGLRTEARYFQQARQRTGVPVPEVLHTGFDQQHLDVDFLLMSALPGTPWHHHKQLSDADRQRLRCELGGLVADLHRMTGTGFGYPSESLGPLSRSWRTAFLTMVEAVLADAERFAVRLPRSTVGIRGLFHASSDVLDEARTPVLVHFDLWDGNILLDQVTSTRRISGVIDAERAFWGDPAAEFVSVALFRDIEQDAAFLAGYRAAGGQVAFDRSLRRRLRLYRTYLYLIMVTEAAPLGSIGAEQVVRQRNLTDRLAAELNAVAAESTGGGR